MRVGSEPIRFHDKRGGGGGAHHPAGGVITGGFVKIIFFEAKAVEDFFRLGFELVAVEVIELILGFGIFRVAVVVLGLVFTHGAHQTDHFQRDTHGDFPNRLVARGSRFLSDIAGYGALVPFVSSFIG